VNGIINIYKEENFTSHDVVNILRKILKTKKVGHTGTLDPMAKGVLPVCVGRATKAAELLSQKDKVYSAKLLLGVSTDTQDITGNILEKNEVNVTEDEIINAVNSFIGEISQIPPMHSAIKKGGKPLYALARQGVEVERSPRKIHVYDIKITKIELPYVYMDMHVSKGTYIRTLCADIGKALNCGGTMADLVRTKSGQFDIKSSVRLETLKNAAERGEIEKYIIPVDECFSEYEKITVNEKEEKRIKNGVPIYFNRGRENETYRVYNMRGEFLTLSKVVNDEGRLKLKLIKSFYEVD